MAGARRRPGARARGLGIFAILTAVVAVACNALNGSHDRVLDTDDGSLPTFDAAIEAGGPDVTPPEASVLEIPVSKQFVSLNGASFTTTDGGTTITAYDGGATHPVIVPFPQPSNPSDDFTVLATVVAPTMAPPMGGPIGGEFGILTRIQPDESAVVFGSEFGGESRPFLGIIRPPEWNPSDDARGVAYTFTPGAHYKMKVRAVANRITAKMWDATAPEPADSDGAAVLAGPYTTGRGIGFYTYDINGAVLESLVVTVP